MGENAARIDWARVGVRLPWRLCTAGALRLAVERALGDPLMAARARALSAWAAARNGVERAADEVERFALSER